MVLVNPANRDVLIRDVADPFRVVIRQRTSLHILERYRTVAIRVALVRHGHANTSCSSLSVTLESR